MSAVEVIHGDCLDVLAGMDACSVDALVTDPPAGIAFMDTSWDANRGGRDQWVQWLRERMEQCNRVLKPGAHAVVWALPRTSHWTAWAVEDAGFEIRDVAVHLFGQGFPKSKHVLKPAAEHWILARTPLVGSVARNIAEYGTGGLSIDGCRIDGPADNARANKGGYLGYRGGDRPDKPYTGEHGRWPANVVLDEQVAEQLDASIGILTSGSRVAGVRKGLGYHGANGDGGPAIEGDSGGPSRFFYVAKASAADRGAGNTHRTVKPVELMRWLIRLVTPSDGIVLDCFAGSGTTGVAAQLENRRAILIETEAEYVDIIHRRLAEPVQPGLSL